jgi:DNA polymerase III delta prime subunit
MEANMSFDLKHLPKTFQDLVIADPLNASIIQQYCREIPSKSLLLAGPPGAGKTEAARVIAQTYFKTKNIQNMTWEFNGGSSGKDLQSQIMAEANFQLFGNPDKSLVVINEIDTLDLRTQQPLFRDFMDAKRSYIRFDQSQIADTWRQSQQVPRCRSYSANTSRLGASRKSYSRSRRHVAIHSGRRTYAAEF